MTRQQRTQAAVAIALMRNADVSNRIAEAHIAHSLAVAIRAKMARRDAAQQIREAQQEGR